MGGHGADPGYGECPGTARVSTGDSEYAVTLASEARRSPQSVLSGKAHPFQHCSSFLGGEQRGFLYTAVQFSGCQGHHMKRGRVTGRGASGPHLRPGSHGASSLERSRGVSTPGPHCPARNRRWVPLAVRPGAVVASWGGRGGFPLSLRGSLHQAARSISRCPLRRGQRDLASVALRRPASPIARP